jgi:hypothetical protein
MRLRVGFLAVDSFDASRVLLYVPDVASAKNYLEVNAAMDGSPVLLKAATIGADLNIHINVVPLGTGRLQENGSDVALLPGRSGGQTLIGGTASSNNLILESTSHATKGTVRSRDNFIIGNAVAATNYTLTFDGATTDGVLTWDNTNDRFEFGDDVLLNTTERLYLTDTNSYLYATSSGNATLAASTLLTLGVAGNTTIGDGTLRDFTPQTASKINLGTAALPFLDLRCGTATLTGAVGTGALAVTGAATVSSTLGVTGALSSGNLTVTGTLSVSSTTALNGSTTIGEAINIILGTTTGSKIGTATTQKLGFFNATPVVQQTDGATLTNNVTSGGTTNVIDNWTSLTVYATDAAAIRNAVYQLSRKMKIVVDALRALGLTS